jgi:hypothetical protein
MMLVFRCTAKLLKELALRPDQLGKDDPEGFLGSWFSHLHRIERRKCIQFTNSKTLYSFFVVGVVKRSFERFSDTFFEHLAANMISEGFHEADLERIFAESAPVVYSRTNSRSVLGSMNDLAYQAEVDIHASGGLESCNLLWLNRRLNRVPMSAIGNKYAIDIMKAELGS